MFRLDSFSFPSPVFARSREKARQTARLSNEKQLSQAFHMYVNDYDGIFPGAPAAPSGAGLYDGYFNVDTYRDPVRRRHPEGAVYAFVDGHAKWERWSDEATWANCTLRVP